MSPGALDLRQRVLEGARAGRAQGADKSASTSGLSIDESLLLHSAGYEAVDLICGISVVSIPYGIWNWGSGEIVSASQAHNLAVGGASTTLQAECKRVGGHGVVGVEIDVEVHRNHVEVTLTGTAVRPIKADVKVSHPFVSDLSARDFALLQRAGWAPVGLAFGASFVYAPRRTAGAAMRQSGQNIELTNLTEAMYSAREAAMERLQTSALKVGGHGVINVAMSEGPMYFARHAIRFVAWGTAVKLEQAEHRYSAPQMVLPMDDQVIAFDVAALRGG